MKDIGNKHIICFHLFNDYSGSPKVLQIVLNGLLVNGYHVDLYTSDGGMLDKLLKYSDLRKISCAYHFSSIRILTLFRFIKVQLLTFFQSFRYLFDKEAVFYVNTILPFGPALAGWIMRKRVIYHCHEYISKKGRIYRILGYLMQLIATDIICVSNEQRKDIKRKERVFVIPNGLPDEISKCFPLSTVSHFEQKTVLMLSSLKAYKGIDKFMQLAELLPKYRFELVVNDTQCNIDDYFKENNLNVPTNAKVYPRQDNVVPFYTHSSLVVNLSDKNKFVETSGLTIIEAIMAGCPAIVPTVGGIKEMVKDGVNGYQIDTCNLDLMAKKIDVLLSDRCLYDNMRNSALAMKQQFSAEHMVSSILAVVNM